MQLLRAGGKDFKNNILTRLLREVNEIRPDSFDIYKKHIIEFTLKEIFAKNLPLTNSRLVMQKYFESGTYLSMKIDAAANCWSHVLHLPKDEKHEEWAEFKLFCQEYIRESEYLKYDAVASQVLE